MKQSKDRQIHDTGLLIGAVIGFSNMDHLCNVCMDALEIIERIAMNTTPGPWYILTINSHSFLAAKPTEDHPYFKRTRNIDVGGSEDYPRKQADLTLMSASPELYKAAVRAVEEFTHRNAAWALTRELIEALKKANPDYKEPNKHQSSCLKSIDPDACCSCK